MTHKIDIDIWRNIWTIIQKNITGFSKEFMLEIADKMSSESSPFFEKLSKTQLAELYIFLHQNFPVDTDPDIDGCHSINKREELTFFRSSIREYLENEGALKEMHYIEKKLPKLIKKDWFKNQILLAKKNLFKNNWTPLELEKVLSTNKRINWAMGLAIAGIILSTYSCLGFPPILELLGILKPSQKDILFDLQNKQVETNKLAKDALNSNKKIESINIQVQKSNERIEDKINKMYKNQKTKNYKIQ